MGDSNEASKEVVSEREGCLCPVCDLLRFHSYAQRITPDLPLSIDDDSPRMALIHDVHSTIGDRHPLGIAERLYEVIGGLRVSERAEDEQAKELLEEMVKDEKFILTQNAGREFDMAAEDCPVAAKCNENRSLIP